jgi:hypothetical protein
VIRAEIGDVHPQSIGLDQLEAARGRGCEFRQRGDAAPVALDGDHPGGAGREQRPGETPGPGADLEHRTPAQVTGRSGNPRQQLRVEQEVLA